MENSFLLNLGVATCGFVAGAAVAIALVAAWAHRTGVILGALVVAAWMMFWGLRLAAPESGSLSAANSQRPWLVAVGAGSALICAGLVAVWRWRRTWLSAVVSFALGAFILYGLVYGAVAYVTHIE